MDALTTLDIFLIVASIVVALVGIYLVAILSRVSHISKVADQIATGVENVIGVLGILEKVPLESVQKVVEKIPGKGKEEKKGKKKK